jgi:hypothetical protein
MTIQTSTQTADFPAKHRSGLPFTSVFLAAGLCVLGSKYRRVAKSLPIILAIATLTAGILTLAGCGGGTTASTPSAPQSKSYVITVTGSNPSSPNATAAFTLIVQ